MTQGEEDFVCFSEFGHRLDNILVTRFTPDSVRVGDYHLDEVDWMSEQDIPVKRMILHENWNEVSIMTMIVMMIMMIR